MSEIPALYLLSHGLDMPVCGAEPPDTLTAGLTRLALSPCADPASHETPHVYGVDVRSAADRYWLAVKRLAHHIGECPCGDDIGLSCTEGDRLLEAVYRTGTAAHDERRRAEQ